MPKRKPETPEIPPMAAPAGALAGLVPLDEFQRQNKHVFPSPAALAWFARKHRDELVQAGALVRMGGQTLATPAFAPTAVAIGAREFKEAARG